jgi:hypothetical protein
MAGSNIDPLTGEPESHELELSKERLRAASRAVDPLKPLRENPGLTICTAAALGAMVASPVVADWVAGKLRSSVVRGAISLGRRIAERGEDPSGGPEPGHGEPG